MSKTGLGKRSPIAAALGGGRARRSKPARTTFSVAREVAQRAQDCAHHDRRTVVDVLETALLDYVAEQERQHGEDFTYPPAPSKRR